MKELVAHEEFGSQTEMARRLCVSRQAVQRWVGQGYVPTDRYDWPEHIDWLTGGKISKGSIPVKPKPA